MNKKWSWITILATLLTTIVNADVDDELNFGGGELPTPTIRLTRGDTNPIPVEDGGSLESRCLLEGVDEQEFRVQWISIDRNRETTRLSDTNNLFLPQMTSDMVANAIYCQAERLEDGEVFEKQLLIDFRLSSPSKTLRINPLPSEDETAGRIVRKCELFPEARPGEQWSYIWTDPSGRVISNNDVLTVAVSGESGLGTYTCEARNLRGNDVLRGDFTISASRLPNSGTIYYRTTIEKITPHIEMGKPYSALCRLDPRTEYPLDYVWYHNGRIVSVQDRLDLPNFSRQDAGPYICEVKPARGYQNQDSPVFANATLTLTVGYDEPLKPEYRTTIEELTGPAEFGQPYSVRCVVNPRPPTPLDYIWFLRGRMVSEGERLNIQALDRRSAGHYTCAVKPIQAYRSADSPTFENATISLRLRATPSDKTELAPPPGSKLITFEGDTRELHCEMSRNSGNPRWYFNGSELHRNSLVNRTGNLKRVEFLRVSILTIDKVEPYQEGIYECRTDDSVKVVEVIVLTEYEVEVNPEVYLVDEGEHIEFHCSVQGGKMIPNRDLRWFFRPRGANRQYPLQFNTPGGFVRVDDQRALRTSVISKLQSVRADEGEYICQEPRGQEAIGILNFRRRNPGGLFITPAVMRIRPGQNVIVECYSRDATGRGFGPQPLLRAFDPRLQLNLQPINAFGVRATISGVDGSFNGTVIQCFSSDPNLPPVQSIVYVEDVCPPGYRRCRNGECLEAGRFCDGRHDCRDGSDEDEAFCVECEPIAKRCETIGGRAPRKNTYMIHWQCDGEDDCGNGFDETSCNDPSIASCTGQSYTCPNSQLVIPGAFVCDKDPDCSRGEDEESCIEPQILDAPRSQYSASRGEKVELRCEVSGNPSPRVIWRFNWGCLPDASSRMFVRNSVQGCGTSGQRVISTLVIDNFRPGDDGIYNCEGLSGIKRAMSRDYIVVMRG